VKEAIVRVVTWALNSNGTESDGFLLMLMGELLIRIVHRLAPFGEAGTTIIDTVEMTGPAAKAMGDQ